jgi:hypothetical protein
MLRRELAEFAEYQSYRVTELFENLSCCFGALPPLFAERLCLSGRLLPNLRRLRRRLGGIASKDWETRTEKRSFPQIERHSRKEPRTELLVTARVSSLTVREGSVFGPWFVVRCWFFSDGTTSVRPAVSGWGFCFLRRKDRRSPTAVPCALKGGTVGHLGLCGFLSGYVSG